MVAVFPEYVMLPDNVGAANCLSKVRVADAALSRLFELPKAIATMSSDGSASMNGTVIVPVVPVTFAVVITALSDAFLTCT
jgi:hypothetical protein